jgi:hypothetical protein
MIKELTQRLAVLEERFAELGYNSKRLVETSIKRSFKIEAQSQTLYAPLVAYCVSTIDPLKLNRIRIFHPLICQPDVKVRGLPFARACSNAGGFDDCGMSWVPPAGSSVVIVCENGDRQSPIYMGTVWHKNRGPNGSFFPYPIDEFFKIWRETENGQTSYRGAGYLVGASDGSQCFPPWDTESNNGINYESSNDIDRDTDAQLKITYPNIYGWKTPGKHMIKMVDGDHRCNNRWARFELMSKTGHFFMMKDDWYHPSGEWANPKGVEGTDVETGEVDDSECDRVSALLSLDVSGIEDESGNFSGQQVGQGADFAGNLEESCKSPPEKVKCSNPYFKRLEECRPYKGAPTPQNNRCALPQSGVQIQSVSGNQIVMDDSVNQPKEKRITWQRDFDFGCDNIFKGKFYFKSATGHIIEMNDTEDVSKLRGVDNGIKIITAAGNKFTMSDHTLEGCIAGDKRGIEIGSTSGHVLQMADSGNEQCSPERTDGGVPESKAKEAFVQLRTGYGLILRMDDSSSQEETRNQFIMLAARPKKEVSDSCTSQPHTLLMQLEQEGGGFIQLASGGKFVLTSRGTSQESVGTDDCPADKMTQVFGNYLMSAKEFYFTKSSIHLDMADRYIILGAGQDCDMDTENAGQTGDDAISAADQATDNAGATGESQQTKGPCIFPLVIARDPQVCPLTGFIHWIKYSNRVFASSS